MSFTRRAAFGMTLFALAGAGAAATYTVPPLEPDDPNTFYVRVQPSWTTTAAIAATPDIGGTDVYAFDDPIGTMANWTTRGEKVAFFGKGRGCVLIPAAPPVPGHYPGGIATPTAANLAAARKAAGVTAPVPAALQWTPSDDGCGNAGAQGMTQSFVLPNDGTGAGGGWWFWTSSGKDATHDVAPYFDVFDAAGQDGSGTDKNLLNVQTLFQIPWATSTYRPFTAPGQRLRIRSRQAVASFTVGPMAAGCNTSDPATLVRCYNWGSSSTTPPVPPAPISQVTQDLTVTFMNQACARASGNGGHCQFNYLLLVNVVRSSTTAATWPLVPMFQAARVWADPVQGGIPIVEGPMFAQGTTTTDSVYGLPLWISQAAATHHGTMAKSPFDLAITWEQFLNTLELIAGQKLGQGPSAAAAASYWGASWNDPAQWAVSGVHASQELSNNAPTTVHVESAGAWYDLYVGTQATPMTIDP